MSKILYICSRESDYLQDLTYRGLVQVVGSEIISVIPWNLHYFFNIRKYPRNLGYSEGASTLASIWRSLTRDLSQFEKVFIAAAKPDCLNTYLKIAPYLSKTSQIIFLDGGDRPEIGGDLDRLQAPDLWQKVQAVRDIHWIFKREYLKSAEHPSRVLPLPFSFDFSKYDFSNWSEQKYDVSFWAVESHPIRTHALELIEKKFDCMYNGTHRNQIFKKYKRKGRFYLEELARCKAVLNFRGVGWDTLRYWEVPAVKRLMISQRPQIRIPDDFEHEKEVIYCQDDLSDLVSLIDFYVSHPVKSEQMALRARAKAIQFHSTEARAKYILQTIGQRDAP